MKGQDMTPAQNVFNPRDARLAGGLYLAIAVVGAFGIGYAPMQLVTSGDPAATASNLANNQLIFRLGVAADSFVIIFELALTIVLYEMTKALGPKLALLAMVARAGMVSIMRINLLLGVIPQLLLGGFANLDPAEAETLALLFFEAKAMGVYVWQIFFAVHLFALGALVLETRFAPRLIGYGLFVGAFGYLIQGLASLAFFENPVVEYLYIALLVLVTIAELSFAFWLLIWAPKRGLKSE